MRGKPNRTTMSKVTDIDDAFLDHIQSEWSAKTFIRHFDISMGDLREHIIIKHDYTWACDKFCKEELYPCSKCKAYFDHPRDTILVLGNDPDEDCYLCEDCHKKYIKQKTESQNEKAGI